MTTREPLGAVEAMFKVPDNAVTKLQTKLLKQWV